MKKQVLEEINRYREIMSLKPITMINESTEMSILLEMSLPFLKKMGMESIESDIRNFMKAEARELALQEIKKGAATSFRAGEQGARNVSKETVEKIFVEIERKGGRALTSQEKVLIEVEMRKIMAEETKQSINQVTKELAENYAKQITKQPTKKGTWEAIKKHFGKHWKKYLAAGVLAAIFMYFYPGETPPEENVDDDDNVTPPPSPYKTCDSFPYSKFCKNDNIRKVQECLGISADGKLGPKTEKAINDAGYSVPLSEGDFNKIMEKCGSENIDTDSLKQTPDRYSGTDEI